MNPPSSTIEQTISPRDYAALIREDLSSFIQFAFKIVESGSEYIHSPHIDFIADRLMHNYNGHLQNLIINMPPRMMKSLSTSVAYPAWVLGKAPKTKIMCISYSEDLARDLSIKTQTLMQSDSYRSLFPGMQLSKKRQTNLEFHTTSGGGRYGVSTGGAIAGLGADIIIIDDPIKPSDASGKRLENCNQWFSENMYQRLNNKNTGSIIVVMQRVHENDLTGFLLEQKTPWQRLCLPAIAEENESIPLHYGGIYRRKEGEALHPERESVKQLKLAKEDLGSYVFAGQYQQQPAPASESIVKEKWFKTYNTDALDYSKFKAIIQSWDTAMTVNDSSDYSAGICIGLYKNGDLTHYYILDVMRKKMEYPEVLESIQSWGSRFKKKNHKKVVVEDAGSGKAVIQSLRNKGMALHAYKPIGDKLTRLHSITDILESGFVFLPEKAPWMNDFLLELTRFPNAKNDDQVDALSQGINWLRTHALKSKVKRIPRPRQLPGGYA